MKHYYFTIFVDFVHDNHVDMSERLTGIYVCDAPNLREALYSLCRDCFRSLDFDTDIMIGLSHTGCYCDDKPINESYRNHMIWNDDYLKSFMWC